MNSVTISGEHLASESMLKILAESERCPFSIEYRQEICEGFELSTEDCKQCLKERLHFSVPQTKEKEFKVTISGTPEDCKEFIENAKEPINPNICIFFGTSIYHSCSQTSDCHECIDGHIVIENEENVQ